MSTSFQVAQADFADALSDGLLGAGTDKFLPMLCAVFMEGTAGDQFVTFTATDRFMLVHRRISTVEPLGESFGALIPADQVKLLIGVHKAARGARRAPAAPLDVTIELPHLTAGSITVPLDTTHEFVKYRSLLPKESTSEIDVLPVNLALLVRVSKMSTYSKRAGVRLRFAGINKHDEGKPPRLIVVEFAGRDDDDVTVILMPMRLPG